jgi:hypothetical protein
LTRSDLIAVAAIFDQIGDALARGDRVELRGFGAFTVRRRNVRIGRNPGTGDEVSMDEKDAAVLQGRQGTAQPAQSRWDKSAGPDSGLLFRLGPAV